MKTNQVNLVACASGIKGVAEVEFFDDSYSLWPAPKSQLEVENLCNLLESLHGGIYAVLMHPKDLSDYNKALINTERIVLPQQ